jgi:hypothetical protein
VNPSRITLSSLTAFAGLAIAATALVAPANAAAQSGAHTDSIRYASVKACKGKDDSTRPCGKWRLEMHSGKELKLPDARITARDPKGHVLKDIAAPIAVSGDGHSVAYIRESDDSVVVRELGGKVHVIGKLPKKIGQSEVIFRLSLDGSHLALEYNDERDRQPTQVYDVSGGGKAGEIPGVQSFQNFSRDGATVLTSWTTNDNTTQLFTYDTGGSPLNRSEPPQVVANNTPYGLDSDGKSVAFFTGSSKKLSLRLYDIEADSVTQSTRVKLGGDDLPEMVDWTGDNEVTVHVSHIADNGQTTMRILQINPETGAVKVRDSYKVKGDSYAYASCGG